jgi:hypothetical protein
VHADKVLAPALLVHRLIQTALLIHRVTGSHRLGIIMPNTNTCEKKKRNGKDNHWGRR